MRLIEITLPRDHNFYLLSDTHEGTLLKHKAGLRKAIQIIEKDPIASWAHLGDWTESICIDDKRYDKYVEDLNTPSVIKQFKATAEEFAPIGHKCKAALIGNHDWTNANKFGDGVKEVICEKLSPNFPDKIYGSYSCKLIIKDKKGKLQYKMFLTHGYGSVGSVAADPITRDANQRVQLKRKLAEKFADCFIMAMGHTHHLIASEPTQKLYLTDNGKEIRQHYTDELFEQTSSYIHPDNRWYINTGGFYKLYGPEGISGYAERKGYNPTELGYIVIRVRNGLIEGIDKVVI